jgi:DMSO/TMAO reductase YedYZ molybdopterin-dependent catalytic subunit
MASPQHREPPGRGVVKPTPPELMADLGDGLNYATRWSAHPGYLTPTDRFYIRNHDRTPVIDPDTWRLRVGGTGVRTAVELTYDELAAMPQTSMIRTLECAGNGRVFFAENFGQPAAGTQWRLGAMATADWTGVLCARCWNAPG